MSKLSYRSIVSLIPKNSKALKSRPPRPLQRAVRLERSDGSLPPTHFLNHSFIKLLSPPFSFLLPKHALTILLHSFIHPIIHLFQIIIIIHISFSSSNPTPTRPVPSILTIHIHFFFSYKYQSRFLQISIT